MLVAHAQAYTVFNFRTDCRAHGVGLVVRVIPDHSKDIGMNILSIIHYRGKVRIVTVDTVAEGEAAIAAG